MNEYKYYIVKFRNSVNTTDRYFYKYKNGIMVYRFQQSKAKTKYHDEDVIYSQLTTYKLKGLLNDDRAIAKELTEDDFNNELFLEHLKAN